MWYEKEKEKEGEKEKKEEKEGEEESIFTFTGGCAIGNRALFPCQDAPRCLSTYPLLLIIIIKNVLFNL